MDDVVNRSSVPAEPARTDALASTYWQARYDEGRTGWDRGGPSPILGIWLEAEILRPCRMLIPGCGRGHEVVALAARGFDVTAVDLAEAAVHNLQTTPREKQLEAVVTQADLLEFTPAEPFAAICPPCGVSFPRPPAGGGWVIPSASTTPWACTNWPV